MFVDGQNFSGLWGRNFVGTKIEIVLLNIEQILVYMFIGMWIYGQGLPMKATTPGPPQVLMIPQYLIQTMWNIDK